MWTRNYCTDDLYLLSKFSAISLPIDYEMEKHCVSIFCFIREISKMQAVAVDNFNDVELFGTNISRLPKSNND